MRDRIFNFQKTINRRGFVLIVLGLGAFSVLNHYVLHYYFVVQKIGISNYLITKTILSLFYITILSPFIIYRLNDIGITKWWILVFWLITIFETRNLILIQEIWGVYIEPISTPLIALNIGALCILTVLLLKRGRYNKAFKNDGPNRPAF